MTDPRYVERPWKGLSFLTLADAGVQIDATGKARIPYRLPDGTIHNWRVCLPNGRCFWERAGAGLIPYLPATPWPHPQSKQRAAVVCEGESDALSVLEHFVGVTADNPIRGYDVIGIPGASCWKPDWRRYLDAYDVVYLIPDGDTAGRKLMSAVFESVPWSRPVFLPDGEDARSLLQAGGADHLLPHLEHADELARLRAAWRHARNLDEFEAMLTGRTRRAAA